jgi:biopolymer transport protein ExbD
MKRNHDTPQNALADIALLLLIFFLITTQFPKEEGIKTTLPPLSLSPVVNEYTEMHIWLNDQDLIMLNDNLVDIRQVSDHVYDLLVTNNAKTRVNLKSHVNASYAAYVQVYDEVKSGYNRLYDYSANNKFGKTFQSLSSQEKNIITSEYPLEVFEGDLVQ